MKKRLTVKQTAERMDLCVQRIAAKMKDGHFPSAARCECGLSTLIPESDIVADEKRRAKLKGAR